MKVSETTKEVWSNIDEKELFPVATNGNSYERCDYSIAWASNLSILSERNMETHFLYFFFLGQEAERIISHKSQSNKREGKVCPNLCHGKNLSLRIIAFHFLNQYLRHQITVLVSVIPIKNIKSITYHQ